MMRTIHLSILIVVGALLSSCGSYIVSADNIKPLHKEDSLSAGTYSDKDFYLSLVDGDAFSDRFCLSIEDDKAVGTAHFIPVETGIVSIISNLSLTDEGVWTPVQGEMILYLKKEDQNILIYDPIVHAHAADKDVPFLTQCKADYSGGQSSLSDYHLEPYCLAESVDIKDISRWFGANPLGEVTANLGPSDKNNNECGDKRRK